MRAILMHAPGGPDVLELQDLPMPQPGPGQARVRAMAIGVGRPDVLIRTGVYKWMPPLPAILGSEMAGIVDAVGEGVTAVRVGQPVLLSARELPQRGSCYAEYACAPAEALYPLPENVGFEDAVSLPNFQLAQALLFHCAGKRAPRSVLLTGAAGAVASALTRLARASGLQVIATASTPAKREFALSNGAQVVIDPTAPDLVAQVLAATGGHGVDLAIDPIGAALFQQCLDCLAPLGTAVSYNVLGGLPTGDVFATLRRHVARSLGVRVFSMHTFDEDPGMRRQLMTDSIEAMRAGRLTAPASTVLPLSQAREAHRLLDAADTLGKIVLRP